ncbi:pirin family protein [Daejeonella oryzae]|uniref:pirin family protein n=1 Tax=Daejeonella oryzae TaxID=1122943 RepID=UPI000409080C|nr:pirin family protein [Daejeonella oryzae]
MKKVIHRAEDRGIQNHGWLKAAHSFSFANYHDPAKVNFGLLRVLNDDVVAASMGFGTHGHDNMEIVTIPLKGALAHKDSLGSEGLIGPGEVQVMSAGKGIRHSEYNGSNSEEVNLLQIWVFPKDHNIDPRYDQKKFDLDNNRNGFNVLVSPTEEQNSMWINQDAFFSMGKFDASASETYTIKHPGNGAYIFLIEGKIDVEGEVLNKRDAIGISETGDININILEDSQILIIEVPMQ